MARTTGTLDDELFAGARVLHGSESPSVVVHRRVPVVDLVLTAACEQAGVGLLHYDADFKRIAAIGELREWRSAPAGTLR